MDSHDSLLVTGVARHECQCTIGDEGVSILPSMLVIESSTDTAAERKVERRAINNREYDV